MPRKQSGSQAAFNKRLRYQWLLEKKSCYYCDQPMTWEDSSAEHLVPFSKNKKLRKNKDNVVVTHCWCNNTRADRSPELHKEWVRRNYHKKKTHLRGGHIRPIATDTRVRDITSTLSVRKFFRRILYKTGWFRLLLFMR
jgi:hypothetical protein